MSKIQAIIPGQVPEFVKANYPVFLEFVKAYYAWLESLSAAYGDIVDLDNTPEQFVKYFKQQLDVFNIVSSSQYFDKKYLKYIKEIYASKGSEKFLIKLLEIAYNSRATIDYPGKYILRSSDGKWIREAYIVLETQYGSVPETFEFIYIQNINKERVKVNSHLHLDNGKTRIYFDSKIQVDINVDDLIEIRDNRNVVYVGKVVTVPHGIDIVNGGSGWSIGQIFNIPGTYQDSICKVNKINDNGTILHASIYEHGYDHTDAEIDISNGSTTLVKMNFNGISKLEGYWKDDSGKLSHQSIRLQDNFYYQVFSYVISSDIPTYKYIDLGTKVNPAGNKIFANYDTTDDITLAISGETRTPFKFLYFGPEYITVSDEHQVIMSFSKTLADATSNSEIINKIFGKSLTDLAIPVDNTIAKTLNKPLTDQSTVSDSWIKTLGKVLSETTNISDEQLLILTKVLNESINISESIEKISNKSLSDTSTISHGTPTLDTGEPYNSETYFSELYNNSEFIITI